MRAVNLLPAQPRRSRRWGAAEGGQENKRVLRTAAAAAGVLSLALGGAFFYAHNAVSDNQATLESLEQDVAAAEAKAAPIRAARADAQARRTAVTTVTAKRVTWEQVLRDLSRVLPANVWLKTLHAQSPTPSGAVSTAATTTTTTTPGSAPSAFVVTGFTSSQRGVARVMDRLSVLPWLSDVSLQQSARGDTGRGSMAVQFTIGANLRSMGGK
jgi:Tfp pilus assembly protein PilN